MAQGLCAQWALILMWVFWGGEFSPSPHPSQLVHPRVSLHLDHAVPLDGWETLSGTGLPSTWGKRIRGFWMQEVGDWAGPWLGLRKRRGREE